MLRLVGVVYMSVSSNSIQKFDPGFGIVVGIMNARFVFIITKFISFRIL